MLGDCFSVVTGSFSWERDQAVVLIRLACLRPLKPKRIDSCSSCMSRPWSCLTMLRSYFWPERIPPIVCLWSSMTKSNQSKSQNHWARGFFSSPEGVCSSDSLVKEWIDCSLHKFGNVYVRPYNLSSTKYCRLLLLLCCIKLSGGNVCQQVIYPQVDFWASSPTHVFEMFNNHE